MNLIAGNTYDISTLRLTGWTEGDGTVHDGYHMTDYFSPDGTYLGPDAHGIEPCVSEAIYTLISVKGSREIEGSEADAIAAAVAMEEELQPAYGVTVERDGETVAEIRDGKVE